MNERNWGGFRAGAGRKATGRNKVNVTLTLTTGEAQLLKERAKDMGMTVSRFVTEFLHLNALSENLTGNLRASDAVL